MYILGETYQKICDRIGLASSDPLLAAKVAESQGWAKKAAQLYLKAAQHEPMHATIFYPFARVLSCLGYKAASEAALDRYRSLVPCKKGGLDCNIQACLPAQPEAKQLKVNFEAELRGLPPVEPKSAPLLPMMNREVNEQLRKHALRVPLQNIGAQLLCFQ